MNSWNQTVRMIFCLILGFLSVSLAAQDIPWILLEKGRAAYENRDLSSALTFFMDAAEAVGEYPEAEHWIGKIYEAQGQPDLAERQYRLSLNHSVYLRVPQDALSIKYSLARLLLRAGSNRWREGASLLYEIINEEAPISAESINNNHLYINVLAEEGIDQLLYLYRAELGISLTAHELLAEEFWKKEEYKSSFLNSALSVFSLLSTTARLYRETHTQWRFDIDLIPDAEDLTRDVRFPELSDGTTQLIDNVYAENPQIVQWLEENGFWSQMYLLSISLYTQGYEDSARSLWTVLAPENNASGNFEGREAAGIWGQMAAQQMDDPFVPDSALLP